MDMEDQTFLGTGWRFPPTFSLEGNKTVLVSDEEDIRQSLWIILSTRKGERILNPEFGCGIHDLMFEEIDVSIQHQIKDLVRTALLYFEPRIQLISVETELERQLEGRLNIYIDYTIKTVNKRSNMVFPFYFLEGTDMRLKR